MSKDTRFSIHDWQANQHLSEQDDYDKRQDALTPGKNPDAFYPMKDYGAGNTTKGDIGDEKLEDVMKRGTADVSLWHIAKLEEAGIITDSNKKEALKAVGHQGGNVDEMNMTGGGASFNAGKGMGHFGSKKKKK